LTVSELVSRLISLLTSTIDNSSATAAQTQTAAAAAETATETEPVNVQLYADLVLNWLLNVYDQ